MRRTVTVVFVVLLFGLSAALPRVEAAGPTDLPERARVDAFTQSLGVHIGRLAIPAIGIDETIRAGVDLSVIDRGVAHWSGTAGPGAPGNMVLAGHRTTHSAPFHDLDLLEPGDTIEITGLDGRLANYVVTDTTIVRPADMWIVDQTEVPTLTMFACHPKGSAAQRIVVRAELVERPVVAFP